MTLAPNQKNIFISFAKKDESMLHQLMEHLSVLKKNNSANIWHQGMVGAGEEIEEEVEKEIQNADLVLLLVSSNYLASDDFENVVNHLEKLPKVKTIPILLRACVWQEDKFLKKRKILPSDGYPIFDSRQSKTPDESYFEIVRVIQQQILGEEIIYEKPLSSVNASNQSGNFNSTSSSPPIKNEPAKSKMTWLILGAILMLGVAFAYTQFSKSDPQNDSLTNEIEQPSKPEEEVKEIEPTKTDITSSTTPSKNIVKPQSQIPKEKVVTPPSSTSPEFAVLKIEDSSYNFGEIKNNQTYRHIFSIKNVGQLPLVLTEVYTNDKFIIIKNKATQIGKGGSGEIEVEINPAGKSGSLQGKIFVKANTSSPTTTLTVSANVKKDLFTLSCNIKAEGVKVMIVDDVSGETIKAVSDENGDVEMKLPTNLLDTSVAVRFSKGTVSDKRNFQISRSNCFYLNSKFLSKITE